MMRSVARRKASHWRSLVLEMVDSHIAELSASCEAAKARGDPELVNLKHALTTARKLGIRLRAEKRPEFGWNRVFSALALLLDVAKQVHSLLN